MKLEIAVQDVTGAELAAKHGADRIELCCALQMGGLTPSQGLLASIRHALPELPVHTLVRPRPGDYVYDSATLSLMLAEIRAVRDAGAAGIVIGALTANDAIDYPTVEAVVKAAGSLHVTFHRAIDHLTHADAVAAVPRLAELGIRRILSSGGATRAGTGLPQLAAMQHAAGGHLAVMAGGGVAISDFGAFHAAGINDVHLSAKQVVARPRPLPMTAAAAAEDASYFATNGDLVAQAADAVSALI